MTNNQLSANQQSTSNCNQSSKRCKSPDSTKSKLFSNPDTELRLTLRNVSEMLLFDLKTLKTFRFCRLIVTNFFPRWQALSNHFFDNAKNQSEKNMIKFFMKSFKVRL